MIQAIRTHLKIPHRHTFVSTGYPITADAIMDFGRNLIRKYFITMPTRRRKRVLAIGGVAAFIPRRCRCAWFVDTMDARRLIGNGWDELKWPNASTWRRIALGN